MKLLHHLACLLAILLVALAEENNRTGWDLCSPINGFGFKHAAKISEPTRDTLTHRFSRLRGIKGPAGRLSAVSALSRASRDAHDSADKPYQNITALGEFSTQYAIECEWDGVPVSLLFDTGSSDTWAVRGEFECEDNLGQLDLQAACGFGSPFIDSFAHGEVDDIHFYVKYGSGEDVSGPMGYSDISCGGLSVSKQQVGLASTTYWHGNNVTVGILGMAYPSISNAFYGPIGQEAEWNTVTYSSFLTTAISQGNMDPIFSVAIMKNSSDGMLAWGGLPPIPYDRNKNASADLLIANLIDQDETAWKYSFYTIVPDGMRWGSTMDDTRYPYVVDTGTTLMYLPPPLLEAIAAAFVPQAVYLYQWDSYFVNCKANPPELAVVIGGVEFRINPADLIYRDVVDPMTGYCAIAIASGGSGPYILGDVFLQNVVAVFDVGGAEMRFYARI